MAARNAPGFRTRRSLILVGFAAAASGCATHFPAPRAGRLALPPVATPPSAAKAVSAPQVLRPRRADFGSVPASRAAREVADWAVASGDPRGLPFLIVDKIGARMFVFDSKGRLRGNSAVLLGAAHGDETVPGIGERAIAAIRPHERTTPAGRFVAERGRNAHGEDIVWVDYDAAVSMHRVRATVPAERRLERLRTPTTNDNRISYGCINVPAKFYDRYVVPAFRDEVAIVYVLPETGSVHSRFGIPRVRARAGS